MVSVTLLAVLAVAAWVIYQAAVVVYRLYFHPLHKFPGPKLAAATFWYETYYELFKATPGQFMYELERLHAIYGPVVRCTPEEVHVKDSDWFDTLFTGPGHVRNKGGRTGRANSSPGSVGSAVSHALHRVRRGPLNPFFSKAAVTELEQTIRRSVDLLCERIHEFAAQGRVLDLGTAATALTLDVISTYCFDSCFNCVEDPELAPHWRRLMTALFEMMPFARQFPAVMEVMQSLPESLTIKLNPAIAPLIEYKRNMRAQAKAILQSEQRSPGEVTEKARTMFHGILRSDIPPEEKTIDRIADEAFVLILAGAETTARVLTVVMTYLLEDKSLFTRLRSELDQVVNAELPGSRALESLPLMRAVVQEALRITAAVTNRPTLIAPLEELRIGDLVIPRGTTISMSFNDILLDPEIFPEPHTFNPGRWLEAEARGQRLDRYLVAFSKGTRSCIGINLAYAEIYLALAALIVRFDMHLYDFDRKRDVEAVKDSFIGLPCKESRGVRVKVEARAK